ncbi:MAG: hypothetical protein NTZ80_04170 [Patescibacteria group bacterium]|nr:hypothetical protein [Patescibacteria group bacterium]
MEDTIVENVKNELKSLFIGKDGQMPIVRLPAKSMRYRNTVLDGVLESKKKYQVKPFSVIISEEVGKCGAYAKVIQVEIPPNYFSDEDLQELLGESMAIDCQQGWNVHTARVGTNDYCNWNLILLPPRD